MEARGQRKWRVRVKIYVEQQGCLILCFFVFKPQGQRNSATEALEASAGVLPVERHLKPLLKHHCAGGAGLELAGSQSRRLGKLGPKT